MKIKDFHQCQDEMRSLAMQLIPHTYPNTSARDTDEVDVLKQRFVWVDGYEVCLHFSVSDYREFRMERLEIIGADVPFLPMYLVCKIATQFLGGHALRYAETYKSGRKVYVWNVAVDERGRPIPIDDPSFEKQSYECFDYSYIHHSEL